jgi:glycosyltransferase involved in cell wall biosynthesis
LIKIYKIENKKIAVISGGVDTIKFRPSKEIIVTRKMLSIPINKIILFTVRNLVPRMGLENLIVAFKSIINYAKDIHLIIGGAGPLKEKLMTLTKELELENHISFVGFIQEELLADYYSAADLFVLPTKELEGFGLVTLEAMACGLPVLGTPVGGTREILEKFDASFIFKETDPESLSELIIEKYKIIKKSPKRWHQIHKSCRKFVEENYTCEKNVNRMEKIFSIP